ncbi:MAG: tryptophan-rich sensory protein [Polaribacter sp.]|jgi:tryptophan-rich sensory protein
MDTIIIWTLLIFINGIAAYFNYKCKSYKTAMCSSFMCGWSVVYLIHEFI